MKTLKMGFLGLALGALGAVALPAHEAAADEPARQFGCCSYCNPAYQRCITNAGNNAVTLLACAMQRQSCESTCTRGC
ncbi:hypothetical protein ACN28S_15665 [Cystobacter fuscus]